MNQQQFKFFLGVLMFCLGNIHSLAAQDSKKIRPAQITFFYPLGTHGAASDSIMNYFSLNLLWGSTGGVKGMELGGLINQSNGRVSGFQAAGLGNISSAKLAGAQLGGLINVTAPPFRGLQAAGVVNIAGKDAVTGSAREHSAGVQLSGVANINATPLKGSQFAGLVNLQSDSLAGVQLAGVLNSSPYVQGVQISGILNRTDVLSGVQFGVINIADTIQKGVQVGLINIVKNGYKTMEVEFNESFYANLNYKMGTRHLYSIFSLAFKEKGGKKFWAPGFGFGRYWELGGRAGLNLDALHYLVNEDEWWTNELNILNKVKVNGSWRMAKNVTVYGGFSLNVLVSRIKNTEGETTGSLLHTPHSFYDELHNNTRVIIYPGINAGIRL